MSPLRPESERSIEPLDAARHDREAFSSGIDAVDNFLRRTANKLAQADNLRVFVLCDPALGLIGYYALNAHAVSVRDLPHRYSRTGPRHGDILAAFVSMMGVDKRFARRGFGGDLLMDALLRIARLSDEIGIAVVLLDVLDCGDPERIAGRRSFYQRYGFQPLVSRPSRLYLPVATVRKVMDENV